MAILQVKVRRTNLKKLIDYVRNENKTDNHIYESVWNLHTSKTAYDEMVFTKERYGQEDGVKAYHFIQSFKPNEVSPEVANEIGKEFARRYFKDEYEVLICTHTDKSHCHNHIVVNSVNRLTGKKFHSSKEDMIKYRVCSDVICKEYGLSTIVHKNYKGKHYAEWKAEKENKPTIRSIAKKDIELAIKQSNGFWCFFEDSLERMGYKIKNGKYLSVKAPFAERYVRLDRLGCSKENISERLYNWTISHSYSKKIDKRYKYKGSLLHIRPYKTAWHFFNELLEGSQKIWIKDGNKWRHKTDEEIIIESAIGLSIASLFLIFTMFIMLLKLVARCSTPPSITGFLKNDVIKLNKYQKQLELIKTDKTNLKINKTAIDILSKLDRVRELRREKLREVGEQRTKNREADYER